MGLEAVTGTQEAWGLWKMNWESGYIEVTPFNQWAVGVSEAATSSAAV